MDRRGLQENQARHEGRRALFLASWRYVRRSFDLEPCIGLRFKHGLDAPEQDCLGEEHQHRRRLTRTLQADQQPQILEPNP